MIANDTFALFCKDVHNIVNAPVLYNCGDVYRNDMTMETGRYFFIVNFDDFFL